MDEYHRYYDFKLGDENVGYFEIRLTDGELFQNARLRIDDETQDNLFWMRVAGDKALAFKAGRGGEWISMGEYGADQYPTSAFPLLLPMVRDRLEYTPILERSGQLGQPRTLRRIGAVIEETSGERFTRSFRMEKGIPVEIDWGGAVSALKDGLEAAKKGSPL